MNWNFLISFFIGIGVYLLFLLFFSLYKRHKIKKNIKKDDNDNANKVEVNENEKKDN